jgi:hypothetical protein
MSVTAKRTFGKVARARVGAFERWLNGEVAAAYDAMTKNPLRGISADKVFSTIRARHAKRLKVLRRGKS